MRGFLLFVGVVAAGWWLLDSITANPGHATIIWGQWSLEMQTATLLLAVLLSCMLSYFCVRAVLGLFGLRRRLARAQEKRLTARAAQGLTQGLIQLAEGHWEKAEALLTQDVQHSETPLLNYLTAARAAHMQGKPEQRDELLRQAIASDSDAQIAVGVSRAEMQMADAQLEQAYATLNNLRALTPQNRYVLKLYAKTLFRQENWLQLLALLPELQQHDLLSDSQTMRQLKTATLRGVFSHYAEQGQPDQLQAAWQQLPPEIKQQPESRWIYAQALRQSGADEVCAAFIVRTNAMNASNPVQAKQDESLTSLYGKLQHRDYSQATAHAQGWLSTQPDNPVNLLSLGRLYRAQQAWQQAKACYVSSINQSPDMEACLELAEMLEGLGDHEDAAQCYRLGLRCSVHGKGERLTLSTSKLASQPSLQVAG